MSRLFQSSITVSSILNFYLLNFLSLSTYFTYLPQNLGIIYVYPSDLRLKASFAFDDFNVVALNGTFQVTFTAHVIFTKETDTKEVFAFRTNLKANFTPRVSIVKTFNLVVLDDLEMLDTYVNPKYPFVNIETLEEEFLLVFNAYNKLKNFQVFSSEFPLDIFMEKIYKVEVQPIEGLFIAGDYRTYNVTSPAYEEETRTMTFLK